MGVSLQDLPDWIIKEIAGYLDFTDLSSLSLVNDYFNMIVEVKRSMYESWNITNANNKLFYDIKFHYDALCSDRIRDVTSKLHINYGFVNYNNATATLSLLPFAVSKMKKLLKLRLDFTHLILSYEADNTIEGKAGVKDVVKVDFNQFVLSNDNVKTLVMHFRSSDALWPDKSPLEHLMDRYPNLRTLILIFNEPSECDKAIIRLVTELPLKLLEVFTIDQDSDLGYSKIVYEARNVLALTRVLC